MMAITALTNVLDSITTSVIEVTAEMMAATKNECEHVQFRQYAAHTYIEIIRYHL